MEDFYALRVKKMFSWFKREHFSFWMICAYLFVEYVRPQSIIPALDILPWAMVFILLSLIGLLTDPRRKWASDPANKWMLSFFVVIVLSSFLAYRPDVSYAKLNSFYTWLIIYFLIINIVYTKERFFVFLAVFIIATFKISFGLSLVWAKRGFSFTTWGLQGPPGFFQNSGELAIQMAVFFPIAFTVAKHLKPYVSKKIFFVLALMPVTAALTILGSSSRGGQIALAAQLVIMFWRRLFNPKILIGAVLAGAILFALIPPEQKERFSSTGNDRTSQQRLLYWQHGMQMMREHPGLGVGYFNFAPYYADHFQGDMLYEFVELPHNIFIQVGTDTGFTGLFIFLCLIYRTAKTNIATARYSKASGNQGDLYYDLAKSLNVSLWGFVVAGQFVTVTYYPFMWINLALTVALHRSVVDVKLPAGQLSSGPPRAANT
ncbi:MAG: hypothetical protein JWM78_3174 [Verrucomicrobiaceae bacterium]|nr:hypothetical protein [Verrucomicrobiaceae bacterium]